jgi:hypothetical protein
VLRVTLLSCCFLISVSASAQGGFFDRAKELLRGASSDAPQDQELSQDEIGGGLKEALRVGTETVVAQLGEAGGFNSDPAIHIPLPGSLDNVQSALERVGLSSLLDDLERRLNRAAEVATPKARELFLQAITDMTLDDVMNIYQGPDDSATRYFQAQMSEPLAAEMRPVIDESLADVGAAQSYDSAMDRYNSLPFVPQVDADLTGYVVDRGMEGIFHYLAQEESAIRSDPVKRTTELLQQVFGN